MASKRGAGETTAVPDLLAQARRYAVAAKSPATRALYRCDFAAFVTWCRTQRRRPMPASPETVALYLTYRAQMGWKVLTIGRVLTAISQEHKARGLPSPRSATIVQQVLKGIRRQLGTATTQKSPVLVRDLRVMVRSVRSGLIGVRDTALLLLGFAGAFRRGELVSLDVADLAFGPSGLEVTLRRSKTDQEGAGRKVGIPYGSAPETCPVRSLRAWLDSAQVVEGPVFREVPRFGAVGSQRLSGLAVARVVKRAARAVGLDAARFSGHSLRAGFATSAAQAGKSERAIMNQTGHRSVETVRRYIREADVFWGNAATGIGL